MEAASGKRTDGGAAASRARLQWVDAGRGISIVLVVLYHSTHWLVREHVNVQTWIDINESLATLRMPLFFTISGLFAGKWLTASWASLWNTKLKLFIWVFLVWEVIGTAVFLISLKVQDEPFGLRHELMNLVRTPIEPMRELWFMWALALFFIVAKLARSIDVRVQLAIAGAVSVYALGAEFSSSVNIGWQGVMKYLFFFLGGIYLRSTIMGLGSDRRRWLMASFAAAWLALTILVAAFDWQTTPGVFFVNCVLGVLAGIAASRVVAGLEPLRRIGSNTLPIYLAHTPIVIALTTVISLTDAQPPLNRVVWIVPPLLAVVAIGLATVLYRWARHTVLRYLYDAPPQSDVATSRPTPATSRS